jgi:hypothetical protein
MLDWSLKAAAPATPAGVFAGVSINIPGSNASSEVGAGSGYVRQTVGFHAASTPAGSATASNTVSAAFGPFSSSQAVSGMFLSDTVSSGAGSMLWYGSLAAARTPLPGDTLLLAVGGLSITLN